MTPKVDATELPRLAADLAEALAYLRRVWFDLCVKGFERADAEIGQGRSEEARLRVVRRELGGHAEIAALSLQLPLVSQMIEQQEYLSASQQRGFERLLFDEACGRAGGDITRYLTANAGSAFEQAGHVAADVARYISGRESIVEASFVLQVALGKLVNLTREAVALAFHDRETARRLREGG